jgi:hypothetical protein
MAMKDLIPWNRQGDVTGRRSEDVNPFLTLHRDRRDSVNFAAFFCAAQVLGAIFSHPIVFPAS